MMVARICRAFAQRSCWLLWVYLLLIAGAEVCLSFIDAPLGIGCYVLLLNGLMLEGALDEQQELRALALGLTLVPMLRLLPFLVSSTLFPTLASYPLIALLLVIASIPIVQQQGLPPQIGLLAPRGLPLQALIAGTGPGLGLIASILLPAETDLPRLSGSALLAASVIILLSTGFVEEYIFRGVIQHAVTLGTPRWSVLYVALLTSVLNIGYVSLPYLIYIFIVNLACGYLVQRTQSLLGVSLARGLMNVVLLLIPHMV